MADYKQKESNDGANKFGQVGYILAHTTFQSIGGKSQAFEGVALQGFRNAEGPKTVAKIDEYADAFRVTTHDGSYVAIPKHNCRGWEYITNK